LQQARHALKLQPACGKIKEQTKKSTGTRQTFSKNLFFLFGKSRWRFCAKTPASPSFVMSIP
jgi:hypothetical protein